MMGIADTEIGFPGKIAFCQKVQAAGVIWLPVGCNRKDIFNIQKCIFVLLCNKIRKTTSDME